VSGAVSRPRVLPESVRGLVLIYSPSSSLARAGGGFCLEAPRVPGRRWGASVLHARAQCARAGRQGDGSGRKVAARCGGRRSCRIQRSEVTLASVLVAARMSAFVCQVTEVTRVRTRWSVVDRTEPQTGRGREADGGHNRRAGPGPVNERAPKIAIASSFRSDHVLP
jgi:hypothetical protein